MLKIRSICLVNDDDGFERTKELLMQLGATHVLRDNSKARRRRHRRRIASAALTLTWTRPTPERALALFIVRPRRNHGGCR